MPFLAGLAVPSCGPVGVSRCTVTAVPGAKPSPRSLNVEETIKLIGGLNAVCVVVFITAMVAVLVAPMPDPGDPVVPGMARPATVIWALASGVFPVVAALSVWLPGAVPVG